MRIATTALVGIALTVLAGPALSQSPPPAPPGPPAEPPRDEAPSLAGYADGFFVRDAHDYFRFYPKALLQTDFDAFFGPSVAGLSPTQGGDDVRNRLVLRRLRLEVAGELLAHWQFLGGADLGAVGGSSGATETVTTTGRPAVVPGATAGVTAAPADVWINYRLCQCFNAMVGQYNVPFSMENRTTDDFTPFLERNLAIRGFVVPSSKDLGATLWGELGERMLGYELGVFGGGGQNHPSVDNRVDLIGRLTFRPLVNQGLGRFGKEAQVGLSGRHGDRQEADVGCDYPAITTSQGFTLWSPLYRDGRGRVVHVLPSGAQNAGGGELRLRAHRVALQGEVYYVVNETREAFDGVQLTSTARRGKMKGAGWYAQLSAWPFGEPFLYGEPGLYRPTLKDLQRPEPKPQRGVEVLLLVAGINGRYDGGSRGDSAPDPATPASGVTLYQVGLGLQYWHSKHLRFGVNYSLYDAPGSGDAGRNQAVVPDNLAGGGAHTLHELTTRFAVSL